MPINSNVIINRMRQVGLDAENATYYDDNIDLIPAINASIEWLVSVINSVYGSNKFSEEFFRELTNSAVFQTNTYSRIEFGNQPNFTDEVWSILAVYPKPDVHVSSIPTTIDNASTGYTSAYNTGISNNTTGLITSGTSLEAANDHAGNALSDWDSVYRGELTHIDSDYDCKRLTIEEWVSTKRNPFSAGNEAETNHVEYAYIAHIDHSPFKSLSLPSLTTGVYDTIREIEIRPVLAKELATIFYVKRPNLITGAGDNIEFPESVTNLIYEKALQFVSFKQGDNTNIYSVTGQDIQILTSAIT